MALFYVGWESDILKERLQISERRIRGECLRDAQNLYDLSRKRIYECISCVSREPSTAWLKVFVNTFDENVVQDFR